jgi:two-component system phosphate regulon sensor histidine kinase PhoR
MVLAAFVMYGGFYDSMRQKVKNEAAYVAAAVELNGDAYFKKLRGVGDGSRITHVASDGTVLYDSERDAKEMENHLDRPEIVRALQTGQGEAERLSKTLGEITFYRAVRLQDGSVVRVAIAVDSVYMAVVHALPYMLLTVAGMAIVSLIAARFLTRRVVKPINELDLEHPLQNDVYDELSPLLSRIDRQNREIENRMLALRNKQRELASVAENMAEGLLLLDPKGNMLAVNKSALRLLNVKQGDYLNKHVFSLNRSMAVRTALELAQKGVRNEQPLEADGRFLSLMANPVTAEKGNAGTVMLIVDVTERHEAEKRRREFSANVSHELKTPLTSISGYAEIIKNGIAKPEDVNRFANSIYLEAQRMIVLVEDIMELSRLDENGGEAPRERVALLGLAREAAEPLQESAAKKGVQFVFTGDDLAVTGVKRLLYEMFYNLLDNAVRYNKEGGSVTVEVKNTEEGISASVADTGIGIPREHHERVFERFYRVDKGRSKETGGTGLGLSIVKHAVMLHNAKLNLESEPGKGTKITAVFTK